MRKAILQELLSDLSAAFATRDPERLLGLFSATADVTYAGSERGERATGPTELRRMLSDLLARPQTYTFDFPAVTFSEHSGLVWLLADGDCTETSADGVTDTFAYRLTGVLARETGRWRWLVLVGSEPTEPDEQHIDTVGAAPLPGATPSG